MLTTKRTIALASFILIICALLWLPSPSTPEGRSIKAASAKGAIIGNQMRSISDADQILWNLALLDDTLAPLMEGKDLKLLSSEPLGISFAANYASCLDNCSHVRFYNLTDGGTIEAIVDLATGTFVDQWQDLTARPNPTAYIVDDVVDIVAKDPDVKAMLGDVRKAQVAMIPMSTWLSDNECINDWCVDLTFHDPKGSGKILHIITNMHDEKVSRTFFTRGRESRMFQESAELNPNAPLYTNGCHEADGWSVCWEMTPHDALNYYDARYNDQLIFSSAKISQVEAYYPSWPGGYRDELGYASTVPPKFDTRIIDIDDGFEVRQLFTEPFDWPNCICCYRYEQAIQFFNDGSFGTQFVSQGPGCDDLSEYRPFWRFDMAVNENGQDRAFVWDETAWVSAELESDLDLFGDSFLNGERIATTNGDVTYTWSPQYTDPLGLDEGRLFLVNSEGDRDIAAGPADTYEPPRRYADGDSLVDEESDLAVWFVPVLKTKRGGPWWCMPDPEPEVSPCYSSMRVQRSGKLAQPTADELAQLQEIAAPTPIPSPTPTPTTDSDAVARVEIPTPPPTPRPNSGVTPEEIILNGGCGACHALGNLGEAGKVGPDLSNIANVAGERVPGQSAETYLYNSIIYPNIYIAEECPNGPCMPNIMPGTYHLTLNDAQVNTLVDYMLTLDGSEEAIAQGTVPEVIGASDPQEQAPADGENSAETRNQAPISALFLLLGLGLVVISLGVLAWLLIVRGGRTS